MGMAARGFARVGAWLGPLALAPTAAFGQGLEDTPLLLASLAGTGLALALSIVLCLALWLTRRRRLLPLRAAVTQLDRMADGELEVTLPEPGRQPELAALLVAGHRLQALLLAGQAAEAQRAVLQAEAEAARTGALREFSALVESESGRLADGLAARLEALVQDCDAAAQTSRQQAARLQALAAAATTAQAGGAAREAAIATRIEHLAVVFGQVTPRIAEATALAAQTRRGVALLAPPVAELAGLIHQGEADGGEALARQVTAIGAAIGSVIATIPAIHAAEAGLAGLGAELATGLAGLPEAPAAPLGDLPALAQDVAGQAAQLAALTAAAVGLGAEVAALQGSLRQLIRGRLSKADRRAAARVPVDLPARLTQEGTIVEGRLADVSTGGARFRGAGVQPGMAELAAPPLAPRAVRVVACDGEGANLAFTEPLDEAPIAGLLARSLAGLAA